MKAIEQHFHVALFIMLYKVVLTFKSVDKTQVCDHLDKSYLAILSKLFLIGRFSQVAIFIK